jgi:protein-disulfide isomerase
VATTPKRPANYDLKSADRKRNLAIQIGLTAAVVVFAVALVLYIVMSSDKKQSAETHAVQVTSAKLITKDGSSEPKALLSLYEDFQCPHCRDFEQNLWPDAQDLIDTGAVAADYYMVAILNSAANQNYSTRAASATIRLNGQDVAYQSPADLIAKVKAIVGNVPGL